MLDLIPLSPTIGAEVSGLDLRQSLDDKSVRLIEEALTEWKVLFFRKQDISAEQQVAFGRNFGELEVHPVAPHREGVPEVIVIDHTSDDPAPDGYGENIWHSDVSWREVPSKASILRAVG